jgi:hypothetical protein
VNPEPREESISLEDVGLDGPQVRQRRWRAVKTFSQWIQNEPKECGVSCLTRAEQSMG